MRRFLCLFFITHPIWASEIVLESRRLHLGKQGAWEWEEYQNRPVDAERLELRFNASANSTEHTLRIWQKQVKLNWPVLLNGKKIGILTPAETAMETLFAIPAGNLKDGENTLLIDAPPNLDDIEIGPISILTRIMQWSRRRAADEPRFVGRWRPSRGAWSESVRA